MKKERIGEERGEWEWGWLTWNNGEGDHGRRSGSGRLRGSFGG